MFVCMPRQIGCYKTPFHWNCSCLHPRSSHQCNWITKNILSPPTRPIRRRRSKRRQRRLASRASGDSHRQSLWPMCLVRDERRVLVDDPFLLIGLKQQLAKIQNCPLSTTHSARNFGFIFDEHLSFSQSDQITAFSEPCNFHICQLCCIRPFLDIKTASAIATSIVQSKLDYCNSLL